MRLLLLFGLLSFSTIFISCGGDDDIEGVWIVESFTTTECNDPSDNGSETGYSMVPCTETSEDDCDSFIVTFAATTYTSVLTSTFNENVFTDTGSGTYTIEGDRLTLCEDGSDCEGNTFSLNGNVITITSDPDEDDGCVLVITARKS